MENLAVTSDQPWSTTDSIIHTPPETILERISDKVEFLPKKISMPKMSSTDSTIHVTQYLIHALENPAPVSPIVTLGNAQKDALKSLADIFGK